MLHSLIRLVQQVQRLGSPEACYLRILFAYLELFLVNLPSNIGEQQKIGDPPAPLAKKYETF